MSPCFTQSKKNLLHVYAKTYTSKLLALPGLSWQITRKGY